MNRVISPQDEHVTCHRIYAAYDAQTRDEELFRRRLEQCFGCPYQRCSRRFILFRLYSVSQNADKVIRRSSWLIIHSQRFPRLGLSCYTLPVGFFTH
jgi:hypothetical protein